MKNLLALLVFAGLASAQPPYSSTVTTRTVTAADCVGQVRCKPGIIVAASTQDPSATAFAIRLTYFSAFSGGDISELKLAAIDPASKIAAVEFYVSDPTLVAVEKILAWPLVNPPGDLPAVIGNDRR